MGVRFNAHTPDAAAAVDMEPLMNDTTAQASPTLEFWYEFGSNYSYLAVMRIDELARQHGVKIVWKPFLLGPIFKSFGWDNSPFVLQKEKGAYTWRDMARQCEKYHWTC